jgi:UDP-glucose 4-epimerase
MQKPLLYYDNNVGGTFVLLDLLKWHNVKNIVFSSSATVYGDPDTVPITETFPARPINPYGHSKLIIEQVMRDVHNADQDWNAIVLRYFNPVGAHPSGQIGEAPRGVPNNLSPYVAQVAVGERPSVQVFGDDYDTPDGTGMRDYIHIMDLAAGHLKALEKLGQAPGYRVYNLGTGRAYSVMEMIAAFEKASGKTIPHEVVARRAGDIATCYADPSLANEELGWIAARDLDEMVADAWRWQLNYPRGFETE